MEEIRKSDGLRRAVLRKITVEKQTAEFFLVTDTSYSEADIVYARKVTQRYLPQGLTAEVKVMKSVPQEEAVRKSILEVLRTRFPAAAAFVSAEDVEVIRDENGGRFLIGVEESERTQFVRGNVLDGVAEVLNRQFCGTWFGDCRTAEKVLEAPEEEELPPPETVIAPRVFRIADYVPIDGANPQYATYIADLSGEVKGVTVCGTLNYAEERQTKTGKPYFSFALTDASGQLRTSYFTRKATLEKIRALKAGDGICLTGDMELFNGSISFRAKQADYGVPPKDFVFESRPSRPVPAKYVAVHPEPIADFVQGKMFGETHLPESFCKEKFVVFDLETTGLNNNPAMGTMDHITEIGAVKIEDGRISEKFTTFVACPVKLSEEIVRLTGITDDMLVGAPEIGDVIADFYKFCDGCHLVGHNVQFDYKFIRFYGEQANYIFEQRQYDTLTIAQQRLRLSNYKLNTIADHYGFTFNHHRAFDDAFVTAKIFLQLVKEGGGSFD